jgi:hypothetical protein
MFFMVAVAPLQPVPSPFDRVVSFLKAVAAGDERRIEGFQSDVDCLAQEASRLLADERLRWLWTDGLMGWMPVNKACEMAKEIQEPVLNFLGRIEQSLLDTPESRLVPFGAREFVGYVDENLRPAVQKLRQILNDSCKRQEEFLEKRRGQTQTDGPA